MDNLKIRLINSILKLKGNTPLAMARYASTHTKFYNRFYNDYSLDNFENLPVMTKYDFIDVSPYDFLSDQFRDKVFL
jgi:phenylacetate-CoA ligase